MAPRLPPLMTRMVAQLHAALGLPAPSTTPPLLTDAEIVRALRRFRYDPEFRGAKRVPIRALADVAGLSHMTLYQAMAPDLPKRPRKISERTRIKLSGAIAAIMEGRLRFRHRKQVWEVEGAFCRR